MIVVTIDLHSAVTGKKTTIGRMVIHNVGGTPTRGDYKVAVGNKRDVDDVRKILASPLRTGEVKNYPRKSYNVWRLVTRALKSAFDEEAT